MASILNPIRLMLLDDHSLILKGILQTIAIEKDMRVLGAFSSSKQLIDALKEQVVDVVLLDYSLGPADVDGVNLIRGLRARFPDVKLLVLSAAHVPATVALALRCGANGFLGKDVETEAMVIAIRRVAAGRRYLHQSMLNALGMNDVSIDVSFEVATDELEFAQLTDLDALTVREREVLRCFLAGMSVTGIAEKFSRSIKTISTQKHSAYTKLGVSNDSELFKMRAEFEWVLIKK